MHRVRKDLLPIVILLLSAHLVGILTCGARVFGERIVHAARAGAASEFYDSALDEILDQDVWVFNPEKSFTAGLLWNDTVQELDGRYWGDETGGVFHLYLEWDDANASHEAVLFVSNNDEYMEWETDDQERI